MTFSSTFSADYLTGFTRVLADIDTRELDALTGRVLAAYRERRQFFVAGNGGSAATASHMAADFGKTMLGKRIDPRAQRFRVIALTDNMPVLTAYGNDVGYDVVFSEQLRNLAHPGDALLVISASGNSPNILRALETAAELEVEALGLLGFEGGAARSMVKTSVTVRNTHYGYIEDAHSVVMHLLTDALKQALVIK